MIRIELLGEANDYVGKGLVRRFHYHPSGNCPSSHAYTATSNTIIGNTVHVWRNLRKICSPQVRRASGSRCSNSGADAVVEGCGSNGCEYMTGGHAVILGRVGDNFAAGMSGGMAFVYDEAGDFPLFVNRDSVVWQRLESRHWEAQLRDLIEEHAEETQSRFARRLLNDWMLERDRFWQVAPKEMMDKLTHPLSDARAAALAE